MHPPRHIALGMAFETGELEVTPVIIDIVDSWFELMVGSCLILPPMKVLPGFRPNLKSRLCRRNGSFSDSMPRTVAPKTWGIKRVLFDFLLWSLPRFSVMKTHVNPTFFLASVQGWAPFFPCFWRNTNRKATPKKTNKSQNNHQTIPHTFTPRITSWVRKDPPNYTPRKCQKIQVEVIIPQFHPIPQTITKTGVLFLPKRVMFWRRCERVLDTSGAVGGHREDEGFGGRTRGSTAAGGHFGGIWSFSGIWDVNGTFGFLMTS